MTWESTGICTAVETEDKIYAEYTRLKEAERSKAEDDIHCRPAFGYHSNAMVDHRWPSRFLPAREVLDPEVMSALSWRDRVSSGICITVVSPAFWAEATDGSHLD